jgi:hypothetical protein
MHENYNILISKLHRFIRKYYLNRMLQGGLWFVAVFTLFFLLVNAFEYYSWSGPSVRTLIFYFYLLVNALILIRLVIIPMLKLFRIGRVMGDEEAAMLVGRHFPEVSDKLVNTIQLKKLSREHGSLELLEAGIDQKTRSLHPVPFLRAVDLRKNRKYLKYAIPPLLVLLVLLFASPSIITEPSKRLIRHRVPFERPLPFRLMVMDEPLQAIQHEDFTIRVNIEGEALPAEVFFSAGDNSLPFRKEPAGLYSHTLHNLQQDLRFNIIAGDHTFGPYYISVLPKPVILSYEASLDYPAYTGKKDEVFINTGDFIVPEGTSIAWKVITRDTREVIFHFPDDTTVVPESGSNAFTLERMMKKSMIYAITATNEHLANPDTMAYAITVIPDTYPTAVFEEFRDSVYEKRLYFRGQISDDYGFSDLSFNYEFMNHFDSARSEGKVYREPVSFSTGTTRQMVFHHFDLNMLGIRPGDEIAYYFEVWDNDEVNGHKSSRSHRMIFRAPTLEEINAMTDEGNREIKDEMEDIIRESRMLQNQIEKLNKQLINKETLSWQDKEQIRSLLGQQQQLNNRLELLQEKNLEKTSREQEYRETSESILQKQEQLQELFDEVMTDEMKKLFEELQKMLDELRKEDISEMLEKMQMSAEDIEMELDKNLELFKQLEFDKKLTEAIEHLRDLAERQEALSEKTTGREQEREQLSDEQEGLNEEFDKAREELDALEKLNQELEEPHQLEDTEQMEEGIQQEMENSLEELNSGSRKKAGESQKNASGQMKEMAQMLFDMQMQMAQESNAEDIRVLREILENLLVVSFGQEALIEELNGTNIADPRYQEIIKKQFGIKDNMKIIEDSLYALSKRQIMIQPFVNKEVDKINQSIEEANGHLQDRRKGNASSSQQYVMTSVNNLALLLSEALEKMQQMQNMDMPGESSCQNPGGKKPGSIPKNMGDLQKQLNAQMQQLKDGEGKQGQQGKKPVNEQFARMAAQQEAIRRQMQEYLEQLKSMGETGDAGLNKLMEEMEKTELDLVNKRLTDETMKRQEEIYTRLLKHENAMREREKEERRESREAKNFELSNPNNFLEYKRILSKEVELLKTVPPDLKPYYKRKVNEYFYNFGN